MIKNINEKNLYTYTEKLVAYVDIIGWEEATNDGSISNHARSALNLIDEVLSDVLGNGIESGIYSDGVLISMPTKQGYGIENICSIGNLCRRLIETGFLTAGGITVGQCYHNKNRAVGPAVNEAIRLEQSNKFPRILCTDLVVKRYGKEGPSYYATPLIVTDMFGCNVVNLFPRFTNNNTGYEIEETKKIIERKISECNQDDIESRKRLEKWKYAQILMESVV